MKLADLLVRHRYELLSYLERRAGSLLRFESTEDLVQGIHLRALENEASFEFRGVEPFLAWVFQLARNYLVNRKEYWSALKRKPAGLFRLTQIQTSDPRAVLEPAVTATGPSTFAYRREQLTLAVKALAVLMPRDRDLVQWASEGVGPDEQAARLGLSRDACDRARRRALERFRKAHGLLSRA